jgi:hypothetical protein
MGYKVEQAERGLVVVTFFGRSSADERLNALDDVDGFRTSGEPVVVMVDMGEAEMRPYSATHALAISDAIARRSRPFSKVAYILRPDQSDMVATTMSGLHGPGLFRRFTDREAALAWLRDPNGLLSG